MIKFKKYKNINRRRHRMSDDSSPEFVALSEDDMMQMMASSPMDPHASRGVEADENRVYFYSNVGEKEVFELVKILRAMDIEMQALALRLGVKEIPIQLHIHSGGGDLFSGFAALDTIDSIKTPIHTYVQGSVASAATLMSVSGKKRFMYKNSLMLIHQISTSMMYGKYHEFLDEVENQNLLMDKVKSIYKKKTKLTDELLDEMLKHDLWLTADQCLEYGLIDKIL